MYRTKNYLDTSALYLNLMIGAYTLVFEAVTNKTKSGSISNVYRNYYLIYQKD